MPGDEVGAVWVTVSRSALAGSSRDAWTTGAETVSGNTTGGISVSPTSTATSVTSGGKGISDLSGDEVGAVWVTVSRSTPADSSRDAWTTGAETVSGNTTGGISVSPTSTATSG